MQAILAVDANWGLAKSQPKSPKSQSQPKMPWHSKADLHIFRSLTKHRINLVSNSTFASLPLSVQKDPEREYRFLTSQPQASNEFTFESIGQLKRIHSWRLIGGKLAYENLMNLCSAAYVTQLVDDFDCDIKLDPTCLDHFESKVQLLICHSQPKFSLSVYFNGTFEIPDPLWFRLISPGHFGPPMPT